jgi:anti-anti-sigma factor
VEHITTEDYRIWHEPDHAMVCFQGFLRLDGMEAYQPIMALLLSAVEQSPMLTLNLRQLEFLNSSGISMLSMFIVKVREKGNVKMVLQGSDQILWQTKSLKNLKRLMPSLELDYA